MSGEKSGRQLFRPDAVDITTLPEALADITSKHPGILLVDETEANQGPLTVEEQAARLSEGIRLHTFTPEDIEWMTSPNFLWGYDQLGFVHIAGGSSDPEEPGMWMIFSEWDGAGLPTGRPQAPPAEMGRPGKRRHRRTER